MSLHVSPPTQWIQGSQISTQNHILATLGFFSVMFKNSRPSLFVDFHDWVYKKSYEISKWKKELFSSIWIVFGFKVSFLFFYRYFGACTCHGFERSSTSSKSSNKPSFSVQYFPVITASFLGPLTASFSFRSPETVFWVLLQNCEKLSQCIPPQCQHTISNREYTRRSPWKIRRGIVWITLGFVKRRNFAKVTWSYTLYAQNFLWNVNIPVDRIWVSKELYYDGESTSIMMLCILPELWKEVVL